jgi:hypothetical protein
MKLYKDHLEKAQKYSRLSSSRWFYFKHMFWAIKFSVSLFVWSIAMLIHAIIPQVVGFTVLDKLVSFLKDMKEQHPDDPILKDVHFDNERNT